MKRRKQVLKYVLADIIGASGAWTALFFYRKASLGPEGWSAQPDGAFFWGLLLVTACWVTLFAAVGGYTDIFRRNRIKELGQTLLISFIGAMLIFFIHLLGDPVTDQGHYFRSLLVVFSTHFILAFALRVTLTSRTVKRVHRREIGFNTIIIGGNEEALHIYNEIESLEKSPGNHFVGFVSINGDDAKKLGDHLPYLGALQNVEEIIGEKGIEEVIIAIESSEHKNIEEIINRVEPCNVLIKIIPDMYDIMSGSVKMTSILGAPLIEVNPRIMPDWQASLKRLIDIVASVIALVLLSILYIILALLIKASSRGPIIFAQERVGLDGRPFNIYKFRTMYPDAEKTGPQLSSRNDPRVTPIGRFLRRTRLDELPQFYNVLKGEMSIVGPRPERQYYIDRILEEAPHYKHLQKVKPGITSWGMVKFGYAENVKEMIERSKYDILYIENLSLAVDLKIMIYTIITVLKGRGK